MSVLAIDDKFFWNLCHNYSRFLTESKINIKIFFKNFFLHLLFNS